MTNEIIHFKPSFPLKKWYIKQKEKIIEKILNDSHKLWLLFFLLFCYIPGILSSFVIYLYFGKIEFSTAQFLLSALIQSQASIIAIVITITFILIQLYSTQYSFKSTTIIREYPATWYLLFFFILSIALNSTALITLSENSGYLRSIFLYFVISSSLLLCFSLILYFRVFLYFLHTESIVMLFSKKIELSSDNENFENINHLETIFEIIRIANKKSDSSISGSSLNILSSRIFYLIKEVLEGEIRKYELSLLIFLSAFINKLKHSYKVIPNVDSQIEFLPPYFVALEGLISCLNRFQDNKILRHVFNQIIDLYKIIGEKSDLTRGITQGFLNEVIMDDNTPDFVKEKLRNLLKDLSIG